MSASAYTADDEEDDELCAWVTVVTVDPGGTTGWSVLAVHPEALTDPEVSVLDNVMHWSQGQFDGTDNAQAAQIRDLVRVWPGAAVVVEDFILRPSGIGSTGREGLSPVRVTAAMEFALEDARLLERKRGGAGQIFRQGASEAMTTCTDERLKNWGYYVRTGGEEHARDATRHALTWMRKAAVPNRKGAALRAAAWPAYYDVHGRYAFAVQPGDGEAEELGSGAGDLHGVREAVDARVGAELVGT